MDLALGGKVAIVNGASQGIGFAIALLLAEEGTRVAVAARREARLRAAAEEIRSRTGAEILAIAADIRRAEDCHRIVAETAARFGRLDILVNNDGAPPLGASLDFDDEAWQKALDQNLMSVVRMTRAAVPHMRRAGGGSIVNITALSAIQPMAGFGLSVASWAGVFGYAKTLSVELGPDRITVNTICPGLVETPRLHKVAEQSGAEMAGLASDTPLGRVGEPREIAALVALLASPLGAYINGTVIPVDGGARRALL
ncbi:MAG: glucose 1-dehydrogenase [Alphaproteobacteria bacterium]|nr:glucose 1-dehydrogenase [Alphaproteobacteria bacterium]